MAFTRRYLKELGIEDDAIDKIMSEHGKSIEGMITKSESEEAVKKAVDDAKAGWDADHKVVPVKESDEYKELDKKYQEMVLGNQLTGAKSRKSTSISSRADCPQTSPLRTESKP